MRLSALRGRRSGRAGALGCAWLIAAAIAPARAQEGPELGIERGARPEAVSLENVSGGEVDLGSYFGESPVLLQFWATWCQDCEALEPRLRAAFEQYGDRVEFFAVAVGVGQSKRKVRRHLERHPLAYPTLWDESGAAVRAFRAPTTSYVVILDAEGTVAHTGVGPDQDIETALRSVLTKKPGG